MQVGNNTDYLAYQYTRAAQSAANTNAEQTSTAGTSKGQETAPADKTKADAVTGTTGNNLSKEVMEQLLAAMQETGASDRDIEKYKGILSDSDRRYLEDIARDPGLATKEVKHFATSIDTVLVKSLPTADKGFSEAEMAAFYTDTNKRIAHAEQVQGQRTAYYESLEAKGLPPAEIYAKILEFNANLPENYGKEALRWSEFSGGGAYSDYNHARLDYLQNLIDQGKSAGASVKTDASTETT